MKIEITKTVLGADDGMVYPKQYEAGTVADVGVILASALVNGGFARYIRDADVVIEKQEVAEIEVQEVKASTKRRTGKRGR